METIKQGIESDSRGSGVGSDALFSLDSVICGDNCEVMRQWPDECIDLVVTSPPYDDLREYGKHEWDFYGVAWNLKRILKPGGVIVWVVMDATKEGSETGTSMRQALHFQEIGLNLHDTMVYQTSKPPMNDRRYQAAWEYMFVLSKGTPKTWNPLKVPTKHAGESVNGTYWNADGTMKGRHGKNPVAEKSVRENVWRMVDRPGVGHPAVFPLALARDHVETWSNPGELVMDCFAGSGTTLKAAKELGRQYVGIEVNPDYVKICEERTMQEVLPLYCENSQAQSPEG